MGLFIRESGNFKGGGVFCLIRGGCPGAFKGSQPPHPGCFHRDVGTFGFSPHRHGVMKICLSFEGCEL